jgi:chemotaxis protein CheC
MAFTSSQSDALGELVNIAFGRAAAALSSLVQQRVELYPPEVNLYSLDELVEILQQRYQADFVSVHQIFSGSVKGDALLLINNSDAATLVSLLGNDTPQPRPLLASDREALLEVGNILLNAFVGSFGNLLKVRISFTVPDLRIDNVSAMLRTLSVDEDQLHYALLIKTQFVLVNGGASGHVALIMGVSSLEALFDAMEKAGFGS